MKMYRVMLQDGGYSNLHTDELEHEEASELQHELMSLFPENVYYIEPYEHIEKPQRVYNEKAADGWEDIYPIDDG